MLLKQHITKVLLLSIITMLISCTQEISVDIAHEPQTVIFGELTNLNQHVSISIQQTVPLNSSERFKPVNNAKISLYEEDANGATNLITNEFSASQGMYTSNQIVSTTIGNTYWIEVVLGDGTQFNSAKEIMHPVVPILKITKDDKFRDVLNVMFSDPKDITNFYKVSVNLYNQGQLTSINFLETNDVIFDGNTNASVEIDFFHFIGGGQAYFPEYDTVEVSLANINFSSYQFLLNQREQIEANENAEDGSGGPDQLFSTPAVSLLGNITNISKNRTALGNFMVSSLSVKNQ